MTENARHLTPILRLLRADGRRFGPGKAQLLAQIDATGSITAAGLAMGMSYKRAWTLVEEMNAMFHDPLVVTARGGVKGGGATLTDAGRRVLAHFQNLVSLLALADDIAALEAMMTDPK
jgi:molybdate transport system regulatory protein